MEKKKIFTSIGIGALVISAPLATFAFMGNNTQSLNEDEIQGNFENQFSDEEKYNQIKEIVDTQVSFANNLLDTLDFENDEDKAEFKTIVDDYAELETFLDSIDIDDITKDELREAFFEVRSQTREIKDTERDFFRDAFSKEEREAIQEQMKAEFESFGPVGHFFEDGGFKHDGQDRMHALFTVDELGLIDSDIAAQLEAGEITHMEAMSQIKVVLDTMDEDVRDEIMTQIQTNHMVERLSDIDAVAASQLENGEITLDDAREILHASFDADFSEGHGHGPGHGHGHEQGIRAGFMD